jgi:L-asparaginase II
LPVPDPVLIEVTRGGMVESWHRGAVAVSTLSGDLLLEIGDATASVYPRSAIKLLQAIPLVESGAADRFGFGNRELALACASHNGEDVHLSTARQMLAAVGRDEKALECGTHWPKMNADIERLGAEGRAPDAVFNNCSGKHAGMLALAVHSGIDPAGYSHRDHDVQKLVARAISEMTGTDLTNAHCGTDGCSIPTYAIPLTALAHAFAKVADPAGLGQTRGTAIRRLADACMAEPHMVAGSDRFCTNVMKTFPGHVFAKTGAEGVFCAALPGRGIGIAVKCSDGATRAAEAMTAAILIALLKAEGDGRAVLDSCARAELHNWNGIHVGDIRPSAEFDSALAALA